MAVGCVRNGIAASRIQRALPALPSSHAMLIDTHVHLYHDRLANDRSDVLARARAAGVGPMVMPAIDVLSIRKALTLCEEETDLYAMVALHPSDTKEATDDDYEAVAMLAGSPHVVAVGESGLDYYWDRSFDTIQEKAFRWHIRLAIKHDLPLILHMRDKRDHDEVHTDIVRILHDEKNTSANPERLRGIFHCFTGPAWVTREATALGFHLGIGGAITFKNGGVDVLARDIPIEQIVLETDSPFLAPVPYRGKRNEPSYVRLVAEKLAAVKGLPVETIARVTTDNAVGLFGLHLS